MRHCCRQGPGAGACSQCHQCDRGQFRGAIEGLVGPDLHSRDGINYPGVIYAPLPILVSDNALLHSLQEKALADEGVHVMPFSALAQSCKTYEEYESRISEADSPAIELVAIGLVGPKKLISKLTGNLALFK